LKSILCSTPWSAEANRQGVLGDKESEESERRLQPKAKANQWWDLSSGDPPSSRGNLYVLNRIIGDDV